MAQASIWKKSASVDELNAMLERSLASQLGIRITELGHDSMTATMPVDERTKQPFGILHGGASVALAETIGSIAAYLVLASDEEVAVGLEINANHIRPVSGGLVRGRVSPVHIGRRTHVWQTHIFDERDRLVCISRLTVAIVDRT